MSTGPEPQAAANGRKTETEPEKALEGLQRENSLLRQQLFESEYRFARLEQELREIKQSGALRIGRLVSRLLPTTLKRALYRPFRRAEPSRVLDFTPPARPAAAPDRGVGAQEAPIRFSVIVPVYNHSRFLPGTLDSLLAQTRKADEIILVDDHSTDPEVPRILERYATEPNVQVVYCPTNVGVSAATNTGIMSATGTHLAFVDCDDRLEPEALEKVERFLALHPGTDFVYSNRIDIDAEGQEIQRWDFAERAARPPNEVLLEGMFTSHLKVISAAALRDVGLFKRRYDLTQDYDLAVRLSEGRRLEHLPEFLYRQRMHGAQQSQAKREQQAAVLQRIQRDSLRRQTLRRGLGGPLVTVVVEALGPAEAGRGTLDSLAALRGRFEVLVVDGSSVPRSARTGLTTGIQTRVRDIPLDVSPIKNSRGEYVLGLQRGILIEDPDLLVKLVERLEESPDLGACCCKSVLHSTDVVWSNGGQQRRDSEQLVSFSHDDQGKRAADLSTLEQRRCGWLPGGAILWRRQVYERFPRNPAVSVALQEQELALRLRAAGVELGNCPTAEVRCPDPSIIDDPARLLSSLRLIFQTQGLLVRDEALYRLLDWDPADLEAARRRIAAPD